MEEHPGVTVHFTASGYMVMSYFDDRDMCRTITHGLTSEESVDKMIGYYDKDPMAIRVGENLWEYHEGVFVAKVSLQYVGDSARYPTFFISSEFVIDPLPCLTVPGRDREHVRRIFDNPSRIFVKSVTSGDEKMIVHLKSGGSIEYFFDQEDVCHRVDYHPTTNPEVRKLVYRLMEDDRAEATAEYRWEYRGDSTISVLELIPRDDNDLFDVQVVAKNHVKDAE